MKQKTRYVILGLLTEGDLSGYQIQKLIQVRFRFFWNESYGQIYPMLKSMVEEGWIAIASTEKVRKQVKYHLTEIGSRALDLWLLEAPEKESFRLELLLKIYFGNRADPEVLRTYVERFKADHLSELHLLEHFKKELWPIRESDNHRQILQVLEFGIKTHQTYVEWAEAYLKGNSHDLD